MILGSLDNDPYRTNPRDEEEEMEVLTGRLPREGRGGGVNKLRGGAGGASESEEVQVRGGGAGAGRRCEVSLAASRTGSDPLSASIHPSFPPSTHPSLHPPIRSNKRTFSRGPS